jgi:2-oxoglutarate ferredoxin oxidoreductase subunit gamma
VKRDVVIAGFGGQGLLFAGEILAYSAMLEGLEVTWMPSYGPQMRGGTANCTVIVSDQPVRSPIVRNPIDVIALNQPSIDKFLPDMQSDGVLVVNSSMARYEPVQDANPEKSRKKIQVFEVPASQIAERLGTVRVANLVALGAYIGVTRLVSKASIKTALIRNIPDSRTDLRSLNAIAFQEGLDVINVSGDNRR